MAKSEAIDKAAKQLRAHEHRRRQRRKELIDSTQKIERGERVRIAWGDGFSFEFPSDVLRSLALASVSPGQ